MNPIEITQVGPWNIFYYIAAAVMSIAVLWVLVNVALRLLKRSSTTVYEVLVIMFCGLAVGMLFLMFGVGLEGWREQNAANEAFDRLKEETGIVLLNESDISDYQLQEKKASLPISFDHEGGVYEGLLIIQDGSMVIHVPNLPDNEREMVLFEG